MSSWDPQKLSVHMIYPANFTQPLIGRKYTLTHSDETGQLFLDIGYIYNYQAIDWQKRDEVFAEWKIDSLQRLYLLGKAYVNNGEFTKEKATKRFQIFKKEMPLAIKAMIQGDQPFFLNYKALVRSPIFVKFQSTYPSLQKSIYYGTVGMYL